MTAFEPPTPADFSDAALIAELKRRGYVVPKRDLVWCVSVTATRTVEELARCGGDPNYTRAVHEQIARQVGSALMFGGALELHLGYDPGGCGEARRTYRTEVCLVLSNNKDVVRPYQLKPTEWSPSNA